MNIFITYWNLAQTRNLVKQRVLVNVWIMLDMRQPIFSPVPRLSSLPALFFFFGQKKVIKPVAVRVENEASLSCVKLIL